MLLCSEAVCSSISYSVSSVSKTTFELDDGTTSSTALKGDWQSGQEPIKETFHDAIGLYNSKW